MTAYQVLIAAGAVLVSGWVTLRTTRTPPPVRAEPPSRPPADAAAADDTGEPEPEPPVLATLPFSNETRARPLRRVSSAMALLVLTLIAAGGVAAAIYRGLLAAWPGGG